MKRQSVQVSTEGPTSRSDTEAIPISDLRGLLEQAISALGYTEGEIDVIVEARTNATHSCSQENCTANCSKVARLRIRRSEGRVIVRCSRSCGPSSEATRKVS